MGEVYLFLIFNSWMEQISGKFAYNKKMSSILSYAVEKLFCAISVGQPYEFYSFKHY